MTLRCSNQRAQRSVACNGPTLLEMGGYHAGTRNANAPQRAGSASGRAVCNKDFWVEMGLTLRWFPSEPGGLVQGWLSRRSSWQPSWLILKHPNKNIRQDGKGSLGLELIELD
jgi:hypothetical protein